MVLGELALGAALRTVAERLDHLLPLVSLAARAGRSCSPTMLARTGRHAVDLRRRVIGAFARQNDAIALRQRGAERPLAIRSGR